MKIAVSTSAGLESVLKRELYKLLGVDAPAINGRVCFLGNEESIARCNLFLRTASRVYIVIDEFKASDFDCLFDNIYNIDWDKYLPCDAQIIVSAKCVLSNLHAVSATQSVVKKAIIKKLSKTYGVSTFLESGSRYKIEVSIYKDFCTVSLDTSGEGLHKRGYRNLAYDAPLKENVASSLIDLTVWNPSRPFADLFCGSGTLPIEAALIARGIPAGAFRSFDFLSWKNFDFSCFEKIKTDAISRLNDVSGVKIFGFDIDEKAISIARKHAKNAGVDDIVHFQRADMRDFSSRLDGGIIISNPPYGERLNERKEIENLYKDLGVLSKKLESWCFYTITPVTDFERLFGKRADKKRKLFNGGIECFFYSHLAPKPPKR